MINYKLKTINSDFRVTEISLVPPLLEKGKSSYTYLTLQKSGWTTFDAQDEIKKHFNLDFQSIGAEGLKDEDAITNQLVSLARIVTLKEVKSFNDKFSSPDNYMKLSIYGYGALPLTPGVLHGNCFKIILRNLSKKASEDLYDYCSKKQYVSFINYYDNQRFGMPGSCYNTHKIGQAIIKDDWDRALKEFCLSGDSNSKKVENKSLVCSSKEAFESEVNPNKLKFYVKSYNSFLWNKQLSKDLLNRNECFPYLFKNVGRLFLPKNKCISKNIFSCPGFAYSVEDKNVYSKEMARTSCVNTSVICYKPEKDEIFDGNFSVLLDFFLPTGSYGTMLIRQLLLQMENNKI